MKINNINNNQNYAKVNFKSIIPVKVYSHIKTSDKEISRQATVDKNIETIIRKFIRILKGQEKNFKNSDEIITQFKENVPDNWIDEIQKGKKDKAIRFSVKNGVANLYTGKDAERIHDLGATYGRVLSANPQQAEILGSEYKKEASSKINSLGEKELHIYTDGKTEFKDGKWYYDFSIIDAVFEKSTNNAYKTVKSKENDETCLKAIAAKKSKRTAEVAKTQEYSTHESKPIQQSLWEANECRIPFYFHEKHNNY